MDVDTFRYDRQTGWTVPSFPAWDSPRTLLLVFGSANLALVQDPLAALTQAYPRSHVIGCSTAGEIFDDGIYDDGLVVTVLRFQDTLVARAEADVGGPEGSFTAGAALARQLSRPDLRGIIVLSDGQLVNGSALVNGINSELSSEVPVTGGLAGDGDRFQATWTLCGPLARSGRVVAVGLYGDRVRLGHGSNGGWDRFGPERLITRAEQNELFELDGKPALDLYKLYLGDRAAQLPATGLLFPLQVLYDDGRTVVRTILGINEERRSLIFAGDLPVGHRAQLMKANFERLIQGAESAALQTREPEYGEGPVVSLAISCVGRRLVLGERAEEEVAAVLGVLPAGTRQVGFYSYGEISPNGFGDCDLHNQTMTLTVIGEGDPP